MIAYRERSQTEEKKRTFYVGKRTFYVGRGTFYVGKRTFYVGKIFFMRAETTSKYRAFWDIVKTVIILIDYQ